MTGSNRLPVLAGEIRKAHADVQEAAKTAAERAIAAGHALIEAKALVAHGQWLPWLRENCALAERTAQVYMKIAKLGLKAATVADLGLNAAAKVFAEINDEHYDPFHHCDDEGRRQWGLFALFGIPLGHIEWLLQRQFVNPDQWMGDEGAKWRRLWGMKPIPRKCVKAWQLYRDQHAAKSWGDIEAECLAIAEAPEPEPPGPTGRIRKRGRRP